MKATRRATAAGRPGSSKPETGDRDDGESQLGFGFALPKQPPKEILLATVPEPKKGKRLARRLDSINASAGDGLGLDKMYEEERDAHLPTAKKAAIAYFDKLIDRYHAAILADDGKLAETIEDEASRLATKMNGGEVGILGDHDRPGYVLMDGTAAPKGTIPRWGQQGEFVLHFDIPATAAAKKRSAAPAASCDVKIQWGGMWGHGFSAHAINFDQPFISETGYRSFCGAQIVFGIHSRVTPDIYAQAAIVANIQDDMKGRLCEIKPEYRERHADRTSTSRRRRRTKSVRRSAPKATASGKSRSARLG